MARLTITMLGGVCWPPSAARSSDSTTTTRVNEVTMMRMPGASDSTVNRAMICRMRPVLPPPSVPRSIATLCAEAENGVRQMRARRRGGTMRRKRHGFGCSLGKGRGEALLGCGAFDAAFNNGLAGRADDHQMLDIVAPDQHQAVAGAEHLHLGRRRGGGPWSF